ncbi:MAG: Rieske (2Fe-2S) protein [Meiothermus sp.]|nr:Rieske (2Fe-2S) protein [Meiothermus sp.]
MKVSRKSIEPEVVRRREVIKASLGICLGLCASQTLAQTDPGTSPVAGDLLVYASGEKAEQPILINEVALNKALNAFPMDPASKTVKKDAKSMLTLVRLDPKAFDANTAKHTAAGIVAYSAICTHQGCPISQLGEVGSRKGKLVCTCHGAVYDPAAGAKVLGGQAKRPLALLPIKQQGQNLVVAGSFIGKVGAD